MGRPQTKEHKALMYGISAMSCSMLHSLFVSFYIDYFVRVKLHRDANGDSSTALMYFTFGQVAYAVWNALNDLGFGWIGDMNFSILSRRRVSRIALGGPLWAISFAFLWFPLDIPLLHPAVQFSLMMIVYDGFFSFTTVSFRALLVDLATSSKERELCNAYAAVFHVIGSVGVGVASYLYEDPHSQVHIPTNEALHESSSLFHFRVFTTIWSILAAIGFMYSASNSREEVLSPVTIPHESGDDAIVSMEDKSPSALLRFGKQTVQRSSMRVALLVWAVQEYSCTFATNFFSMFLAITSGHVLGPGMRSALLLLSFVVPHIVTLGVTPILQTVGKKKIVSVLFVCRAVLGIELMRLASSLGGGNLGVGKKMIDRNSAIWFATCLLLNRVLTEAVCRLQGLVLSDVTDEDTVVFNRRASMAAAVHGIVSLVSKPSQSIAPVVSCYFLANHKVILSGANSESSIVGTLGASAPIIHLVGVTSAITASLMFFVWTRWYDLDGKKLTLVRHGMRKRTEDEMCDGV